MCSNDDIDWPVHSLMLSFHDLRGRPLQQLHPLFLVQEGEEIGATILHPGNAE